MRNIFFLLLRNDWDDVSPLWIPQEEDATVKGGKTKQSFMSPLFVALRWREGNLATNKTRGISLKKVASS